MTYLLHFYYLKETPKGDLSRFLKNSFASLRDMNKVHVRSAKTFLAWFVRTQCTTNQNLKHLNREHIDKERPRESVVSYDCDKVIYRGDKRA